MKRALIPIATLVMLGLIPFLPAEDKVKKAPVQLNVQRLKPWIVTSGSIKISPSVDLLVHVQNNTAQTIEKGRIEYTLYLNTKFGRQKLSGKTALTKDIQPSDSLTITVHAQTDLGQAAGDLVTNSDPVMGWWVKLYQGDKLLAEEIKPKMAKQWDSETNPVRN